MTRHVRRAAALTAVALGIGVVGACSSDGTGEVADDGVITIFAPQGPETDLDQNAFTLHLEERFDVDLQFETTTFDAGAAAEARQISLASGSYPDAYMLVPYVDHFSQAELLRLGGQGVLLPLNDLIEQYAPATSELMTEVPDYAALATAPDGNIWGLPQWNDCYHCSYPSKFWINTQWLENLGLDQPTTPEELFDVLMAFKNDDPNGNGVVDEIPITSSAQDSVVPFIMNAFISNAWQFGGAQPISLGLDGDRVQIQAAQDGWREGLVFLNSLWENGLIDESAFSQNRAAMLAKGDSAEGVLVGSFTGVHPGIFTTLGLEDARHAQYDALPPLTGPGGDNAAYVLPSSPGATFVITNNASDAAQEKLMQIIDYMYTEEGMLLGGYGSEGINWAYAEDGDIALDEDLEAVWKTIVTDKADPEALNNGWGAGARYAMTAEFRNSQVQPLDIYTQEGFERRLFEATELYDGHDTDAIFPYWNSWVAIEDGPELSTLQTNVENYISTSTAEFITGARDPGDDAAWSSYVEGLTGLGADRYIEIWQNAYDTSAG
ncbi:extracellular solute-binding protein [Pseudactinotalea terrae]|uniref:extracellular solute-binding protein n=1 Tax=Pseudactinotalea terrae TaxID=1743262 RepID=UPI0012E1CEFA|nr:extracellular solute-binding protein [Pseudactinotalea terrae]